ncbi:hypothetical protein KC336_g19161, partial [Hortaea werneckii]
QFNEIDAKGLQALADAAGKALPRLRRVEVNGNKFAEEDPSVEALQEVLSKRKGNAADEYPDVDEDDEDAWGVDELDELEDEDSEDEEEDDEVEDEEEQVVKDSDAAEQQPVAERKDKDVDDLATALGKTELK